MYSAKVVRAVLPSGFIPILSISLQLIMCILLIWRDKEWKVEENQF